MVRLLRHRQTKGAATDRLILRPPRHILTLPEADCPFSTHLSHSSSLSEWQQISGKQTFTFRVLTDGFQPRLYAITHDSSVRAMITGLIGATPQITLTLVNLTCRKYDNLDRYGIESRGTVVWVAKFRELVVRHKTE
jgi:hypothetical protein